MLCKSMSFCPSCSQCPQCYHQTECRGKVTNILASLARNGCKSSGDFCLERGLHPSVQTETTIDKVSHSSEWLCKPSKEPVLKGSLTKSHEQVGSRKGGYQVVSGFLQPGFPCPQTKQKMEPNLGPELNLYLSTNTFKMETLETIRLSLQTGEWVTSLDFCDAYFHIPINQRSQKCLRFFLYNQTFQFTALPFGLATAPLEFTKVVKEVKLMAQARGIRILKYLDDGLLRALRPETCLQTHPDPFGPLPAIMVVGKHEKIRANTATGLQFRRLPVRPGDRSGSAHSGLVDNPPREVEVHKKPEELYCQAVYVSDRTAHSNGKAGMVRSTSHEAHPMALEATLACSQSSGEGYSGSSSSSPPSRLVVGREQCAEGPTPAPPSTRCSAVYRRLKRRLGCTLRGLHCKRRLASHKKLPPHQFF